MSCQQLSYTSAEVHMDLNQTNLYTAELLNKKSNMSAIPCQPDKSLRHIDAKRIHVTDGKTTGWNK